MEQLGVQPLLLLAQIINFGIVVFLLNKVLFKPVLAFLEKRKKEIDEGLALTHKMQEEEAKLDTKREKTLESARREAREITDEARRRAKIQEKELLDAAHKEAQAIVEKAKAEAREVIRKSEKDVREDVIELSSLILERLIPKVITKSDHKKLLNAELKEVEKHISHSN